MTLAANTLLTSRTLTYFVRIYTTVGTYSGANVILLPVNPTDAAGVPGVVGIRISKSFDSPVPVCQLDLNRVSSWIKRGMGVTVDVGYNGLTQRLFTGFVQSRERGVGKGTVNCMGRLWTAFRTVQIGQRDIDGDTVETAIGDILDYVGLTDNRTLTIPAFTLGTASSPVLERMPASQMLQQLMDIDGCRIYELGTGQIIVRVIDELPAPTAYKTYTTNDNATARVLEGSDREDPEYYRNRVIVTGATVTEGSAPDETSRTITATATVIGSALVQPALPAGTYVDAEYNNHLIDTDAKAADVALRLLYKFARIPRQIVIEIAGDPELELGQTIEFVMPELDLNDRGFISGIEHVIDSNGYVTRLTDFRGAGDTGGTLAQNPIAAFTFKSEVEMYGAQTNVVATLDATPSFDPDGTIVSYAWSDNQTTTPEIATFTSKFPIVRADTSGWTGSWDVTLTVTDNDGLTSAVTITIPYTNTDPEIVIPAVYAAINNRHSGSLDGAVTWNDSTVGSGNSISVGARPADGVNVGHACYGTSTGRIYRTTDGGATVTLVYTSAAAVAINDVRWDWRNGNVVWALDENCIVYISLDAGVTWTIYKALRTQLSLAGALGNQIGLPAAGGVYVFGGTGAGAPLIAYDPVVGSQAWVQVALTGNVKTDTIDTPADATMRIVDYTAGFTQECMILSWASGGGASITAVYTTPTGGATSRAFTRASTTFGGLKTGRWINSDNVMILSNAFYCAFANRSIWASTDGVAWTETTNVMPVGVTPWHAIGMTGSTELTGIVGMFGVFMIAASDGIYKWTVGEATASYIRGGTGGGTAWPASAIGKKLAIGAPGATSAAADSLFVQQSITGTSSHARRIAAINSAAWRLNANPGAASQSGITCLVRFGATMFRIITKETFSQGGNTPHVGQLQRSTDDGANWADVGPAPVNATGSLWWGCNDVTQGANGTLWATYTHGLSSSGDAGFPAPAVYNSTDDGANWVKVYEDTSKDSGFWRKFLAICPHPINQDIVSVVGQSGTAVCNTWTSTDATAGSPTFTRTTGAFKSTTDGQRRAIMLSTGRIVQAATASGNVGTSDDYGANWTDTGESYTNFQYALIRGAFDVLYSSGGTSSTVTLVKRSRTYGTTWETLFDDTAISVAEFSSLVYKNGTLYASTESVAATNRVLAVVNADTVTAPGTPIDVSYNLDLLLSGVSDRIGMGCLA